MVSDKELIYRDDARAAVLRAEPRAAFCIDRVKAVDAVEVVHAHWAHLGGDEWCCTACGEVIHTEGSWEKPNKKYCYECGAKMDGDLDGR